MEPSLTSPEEQPERPLRITARLSAQSLLSPDELRKTIGEVKTAAEEEQARLSHPLPDSVAWYRRPLVAGVLLVMAAAVWAAQLWAWKPELRQPTAQEREGGLRYEVAMQAARIEDFRERTGRLPKSLKETEEEFAGMTYLRLDSARFRLTARDSNLVVTWRSDSSLMHFLGSTLIHMKETKLK